MYQTSDGRALWEEWIQWMFYFSMCHDKLNDPTPPRLRLTLLRLTNPQCSPESRDKTEPTWTNTGTSLPTAGDLEPTRRSQWVLRNAYGKARLSAKETVRQVRTDDRPLTSAMLIHWEILKVKVAYIITIKSETYIQRLFSFLFFALVFAL